MAIAAAAIPNRHGGRVARRRVAHPLVQRMARHQPSKTWAPTQVVDAESRRGLRKCPDDIYLRVLYTMPADLDAIFTCDPIHCSDYRKGRPLMNWIYWLSGAAALGIFIYLVIALFKPELFE